MPNCDLMSWVTLTVLCIQVIITDIDVLVNYSSRVSCSFLIVLKCDWSLSLASSSASCLGENNFLGGLNKHVLRSVRVEQCPPRESCQYKGISMQDCYHNLTCKSFLQGPGWILHLNMHRGAENRFICFAELKEKHLYSSGEARLQGAFVLSSHGYLFHPTTNNGHLCCRPFWTSLWTCVWGLAPRPREQSWTRNHLLAVVPQHPTLSTSGGARPLRQAVCYSCHKVLNLEELPAWR